MKDMIPNVEAAY